MPYRPKSREEIARNMAAIRSKDNRTEAALRKALYAMGFRYRKYLAGIPGRPDIAFSREKVAVFVDGDYWHGRVVRERGVDVLRSYYTEKQRAYWIDKLSRNVARDDRVNEELRALGWLVVRFWESDIKKDIGTAALQVASVVRDRRGEAQARGSHTQRRSAASQKCASSREQAYPPLAMRQKAGHE
jgi:DNA mismatch endonuclease (patch repair protein)